MEIRYAISWRRYETLNPSLTVLVYAANGQGTILSNNPRSNWSHFSYMMPEMEISEYSLTQKETSLRERYYPDLRQCEYTPEYSATREQIIDLFCRGPQQPISAETIESIMGIPTVTTMFFNHQGFVPAADVLRELRQRMIPADDWGYTPAIQ